MALEGAPLVLVVDDVDDNRLLYATTIGEAGYLIDHATNGQEALERISQNRPAIVVMDLSMPILDGWEATRRIKANPQTAKIAIIALTAHTTKYGLQQATDAGADAVLTKPCLPQDLLGVIASFVPFPSPHSRGDP